MENLILQEVIRGKGGKIIWSQDQLDFIISSYNKDHSIPTIAKFFKTSSDPIRRVLRQNNIKLLSQQEIMNLRFPKNSNFFENIDTPQKAYWLGFLYADGCVTKTNTIKLFLKLEDEEHIKKFQRAVEAFSSKIFYENRVTLNPNFEGVGIAFRDKKMAKDLCDKGCIPNKSLILTFPYNQLPENLYSHFIRGYIDGDGSLYWTKYDGKTNNKIFGLSIVGTESFLNSIKKILGKDNLSLSYEKEDSPTLTIRGGKQLKHILEYIYKDSYDEIELTRKREKYNEFLRRLNGEPINVGCDDKIANGGLQKSDDTVPSLNNKEEGVTTMEDTPVGK